MTDAEAVRIVKRAFDRLLGAPPERAAAVLAFEYVDHTLLRFWDAIDDEWLRLCGYVF